MSHDEAGPLLALVLAAQQRHSDYAQTKRLIAAAECLAEYARAAGASLLLAASPLAERVVGAAVVLADGQLESLSLRTADDSGEVLVVDVAIASPLTIEAATTQAHVNGAQRVRGVALDPLAPEASWFSAAGSVEIELLPV